MFLFYRRSNLQSEKECEEQKDIVKSLKKDIEGISARMSDLKGM